MQLETALQWSWMNVLNPKRLNALLGKFGSLEEALRAVSEPMLRELGCKEETAMIAMNRLEEFNLGAYAGMLRKLDAVFLTLDDDLYPRALRTLPDPPVFLYARGDLTILDRPSIALVGSRDMNAEGERIIESLVPPIVAAGCTTVSGLAFGVDAAVAEETLRAGGRTVAVLGNGLGTIHPKANEKLAEKIISGGGLVLSEYPLDTHPDKFTFPARNRIIAGLALSTVVVQAAEGSGSLITAELALEYGREVCAVPGSIFDPLHAGCHRLLSSGQAKLVSGAGDILSEVGIVASARPPEQRGFHTEDPAEAAVAGALTSLPAPIDDLVVKAKLDAATLTATLTVLEMKGVARKIDGKWIRA